MLGPQAEAGERTWGQGGERGKSWGEKVLRGLKLDNLRKAVLYGDVSAQERACDEFRDIERAVAVDEDEGEGSTDDEKEAPVAEEVAKRKKKRKKKRVNKKKRRSVGHAISALRSELHRVGKALLTLWSRAAAMLARNWVAYFPTGLGIGERGARGGYVPAPFIR